QKQRLLKALEFSEEKNALLIVACSETKNIQKELLPVVLRYLGACFMPLKTMLVAECWPRNIELMIISAKYGFVRALDPLPYYDERLIEEMIEEKQTLIEQQVGTLDISCYETCLVNLPKGYEKVVKSLKILLKANKCQITTVLGRLNERNDAMLKWLTKADEKHAT
ncbi:MAG: hypothetical protein ACFFB3_18525, partial [Candidatus Hodarchaeota archaeon]